MNPDSSNVELDSVKQAEEGEYVQEGVQQEEGTVWLVEKLKKLLLDPPLKNIF